MLLTSIMCGLVGYLIGHLACTGFIGRMNPRARLPNTKGTSHKYLGTGFDSFPASEEYSPAPNPKGVPDEHLGTGLHGYQSSEEYDHLYNSKSVCDKYRYTPIRASMSSEQFHCVYVIIRELFLVIDYRERHHEYEHETPDSNSQLTHA